MILLFKPKYGMIFFVDSRVIVRVANVKLFCFDLQNNFKFTTRTKHENQQSILKHISAEITKILFALINTNLYYQVCLEIL